MAIEPYLNLDLGISESLIITGLFPISMED
jgi:hypothetical protein